MVLQVMQKLGEKRFSQIGKILDVKFLCFKMSAEARKAGCFLFCFHELLKVRLNLRFHFTYFDSAFARNLPVNAR